MRLVLYFGAFVLGLVLFAGWALWDFDVVTREYATYEDAAADRVVLGGWLPEFIPASATRIVTRNDLDFNDSSGEFHYDPADTTAFVARLRPLQGGRTPYVDYESRVTDLESDGYRAYEYADVGSVWVFFVDRETGHVLYDMWPNRGRRP